MGWRVSPAPQNKTMRIYDIKTAHYYRYKPLYEDGGIHRIDFYQYHLKRYSHDRRMYLLVTEGSYERAFSMDIQESFKHSARDIITYLYSHHRL